MEIENRIKELRYIPASELRANPKNWRKHPTQQQKMLRTMFNEVGYIDALIGRDVDDGSVELIDGHLRKEMSGHQDVPVLVLDVTQAEADLILASFDPITGMADTDKATLKDLLQGIDSEEDQISEMLDKLAKDSNIDLYDDQPEPEARIEIADELQAKWKTELGQLWQIGKHRVLCGDCTDADLVARLMDGKKADMVFTDPPYGIGFEYNSHKDKKGDVYEAFCDRWFDIAQTLSKLIVIFTGWSYNKYWYNKDPYDTFYWIVKNKHSGGKNSHYRTTEPILMWGRFEKQFNFDYILSDSFPRATGSASLHSCPKPVGLYNDFTKRVKVGGIVVDLFLGSSTSMVSCENIDRVCYGMELDPMYVAVGLERMSEMGLKPELIDV